MPNRHDLWGNLGNAIGDGLAGGVNAYYGAMRQRKQDENDAEHRRHLAETHGFNMAKGRLGLAEEEAAVRYGAGDYQGAMMAGQQALTQRNAMDGGHRVGPKFIGTATTQTVEAPRPTPGFMGPMPGKQQTTYDPSKPDWGNETNRGLLLGMGNITPPKPIEVSPGATLYNPVTNKPTFTAPYTHNPDRLTGDQQLALAQWKQEQAAALRRQGWSEQRIRQAVGIEAAGERQQAGIAAAAGHQARSFGAQDAKAMAQHAQDFAAAFPGASFTSRTRTPAENRTANGVPNSYHLTGQAFDVIGVGADQAPRVKTWAAERGLEALWHNAGSGYHWHFEPAPGVRPVAPKPQRTVWSDDGTGNRTRVVDRPGVTSKNPAPKPKTRLVQQPDGSWVEVKGGSQTTPKAPRPAKPFDRLQAQRDAYSVAGQKYPDTAGIVSPQAQASRDALVEDLVRRAEREHGAAQGVVDPLDQAINDALSGARRRAGGSASAEATGTGPFGKHRKRK